MHEQPTGSFSPGNIIAHRYEILRPLRSEPHGEVILARDQVLDIDVGLKVLSNEHPDFTRFLDYYRREALWGLKLHHPQILGVHHLDETAEGVFLIQEPFAGNPLGDLLGHSEALTTNDSLYFIEVLAQGLALAHKQGIHHQNFNPRQVLVSATDGIKIINFAFPVEPLEAQLFPEIQAYIAPEVWEHRPPTAASNLFSLGVIGYRMLTGAFPFPLHPEGSLPYQLSADLVAFDHIPEPLQPLFIRCLKADPPKRFQSAADFLSRLAALREKLYPGAAPRTKTAPPEIAAPPPASPEPALQASVSPLEPEVAIDSDWQEANAFPRPPLKERVLAWLSPKQQQVAEFFGPEPLRRNRLKQAAAALGAGLVFFLLFLGLSSLFTAPPKPKLTPKPETAVSDTAAPSPAAPAVVAAAPGAAPEAKPAAPPVAPPPVPNKPAAEEAVPPAPAAGKKPAPAVKPPKPAPKPAMPPAAKIASTAGRPKLVAVMAKELPARKKADALTREGQKAIVKIVKKGDKKVYQVWLTAAAPAKPAAKPKPAANPH